LTHCNGYSICNALILHLKIFKIAILKLGEKHTDTLLAEAPFQALMRPINPHKGGMQV
jgi:hypothetical protein